MHAGVGISDKPLAWEAGLEAARQATSGFSRPASLAIVFATESYDQEAVLASAKTVLGEINLVGASSTGLFTRDKIVQDGVGILALAGEELETATALVPYPPADSRKAGITLGERLLAGGHESGTLICFPDGFTGNISRMLDGLYDTAGPEFVYAGGGTGSVQDFSESWQISDEGATRNAVAAAFLGGCKVTTLVDHEWVPGGAPLVITHSSGKIVDELDGRPAFQVYSERLGGIRLEDFPHASMQFPFGISYGRSSYLVRDPVKVVNGTAIEFATEIPQQAVAYIMQPREEHPFSLAEKLGKDAFRALPNPHFALASYCISRSLLRGEAYRDEIRALLRSWDPHFPVLGFLALGEIGCYGNGPQLHNKGIALMVGGA